MSAPYTTMAQVTAKIPPQFLLEALDDDGDGQADPGLFNQVVANVATEIEGALGQRYAVPFDNPLPAVVASAALTLACYGIYARRVTEEMNPFAKLAKETRDKLAAIAKGEQSLQPFKDPAQPSATAITEPARTSSRRPAI
jgi:phage gp36-like protein